MKGTCRNLSTKNGVWELPFCGRWPMLAVPSGRLEGPGVVGGAAQGCGSSLASAVNGGSALPHLFHTDSVRIKPLISEDFQMQTVPVKSSPVPRLGERETEEGRRQRWNQLSSLCAHPSCFALASPLVPKNLPHSSFKQGQLPEQAPCTDPRGASKGLTLAFMFCCHCLASLKTF